MKHLLKTIFVFTIAISCVQKESLTSEQLASYKNELDEWHARRIERVTADDGWLNLVGLLWLHPGNNTFGASNDNNIVFPEGKIADNAGYFVLTGEQVTIHVNKDVKITSKGQPVTELVIFHPDSSENIVLESGSLRWNIIKRDAQIGIRLRDLDSPLRTNFKGVERFPADPDYRINATFEKSDSLHTIDVANVLGQTVAQESPGSLVFSFGGSTYRLDALAGGKEELFIVFGDETSGKETYGGGRFLYVKKPAEGDNTVVIDFNKSYNPPCVFTPYATCPLPPKQNILPIAIRVGEKDYHNEEHVVEAGY
jgi:uncharacterized protein (DUF1684 family)